MKAKKYIKSYIFSDKFSIIRLYSAILLYWNTLRKLKVTQILNRIWFSLYIPHINFSSTALPLRVPKGNWFPPLNKNQSIFGPRSFCFLNQHHSLPLEGGWNDAGMPKLWLYNLHYFDDLNSRNSSDRKLWHGKLINRWIYENPPSVGNGWEPYPTSIRIVNWIKWLSCGNSDVSGMLKSLTTQVEWLEKRIEYHLLGNHLFANAKALIFAGLFFEGDKAKSWRQLGLKIVNKELTEQVLMDGGHFERSTMYHSLFLEDILDLINAAKHWPGSIDEQQISFWREITTRMFNWLSAMTHPDSKIALFNDAAFNIALSLEDLQQYASGLGLNSFQEHFDSELKCVCLEQSGYIRVQMKEIVAILDVGPIGPEYLPGHAHADTLTFELSLYGYRFLVNGGTSVYEKTPIRLYERGTSAHNTVEINQLNSSQVWSSFRVAKRAYPSDLLIEKHFNSVSVSCSHDGYAHLRGKPIHKRYWEFKPGKLIVRDEIDGECETAIARFHFEPNLSIKLISTKKLEISMFDSDRIVEITILNGSAHLEESFYSPEFGVRKKNQCLSVHINSNSYIEVEFSWSVNE